MKRSFSIGWTSATALMVAGLTYGSFAAEFEIGGPLEGLKGALTRARSGQVVAYPGSVEHWRAGAARSFFDQQSLLKNWVVPDIPSSVPPKVETYAGVKVARCGASNPVFRLDLGDLDVGLYVVRVIGTVDRSKIHPFREPLYVTMRVNDGLNGETQTYRLRVGYSEEFRSVAEIYFHAVQKRRFAAELFVDRGSAVDLLVHNVTLDDVLAGTDRRAIKTRMTLTTPEEIAALKENVSAARKQRVDSARPYPPAERLARDAAIWKWLPPINAQGTQTSWPWPPAVTHGTADKTQREIAAEYGDWKDPVELFTSKPGLANAFLVNAKLHLQYTMDDFIARKPLPGPYPYPDDGSGFYFPDPQNPDQGRCLCPIGMAVGRRVRSAPTDAERPAELWLQTGNRDTARDAAIALVRYAWQFPTYDAENWQINAMYEKGEWQRTASPKWMAGNGRYMAALHSYDELFDYLRGNEELAQSIGRFIPWVKTSEDVIRLLDVYLVQTTAKHVLRRHYGSDNNPAQLVDVATVLGDAKVTDPWMEWVFAKTYVYGVGTGGVQDLMISGDGREGAGLIGSTFYSQGEGARAPAEQLQRYLDAGGNPKFSLLDFARYPKPLAHCYWQLGIMIGGLEFARIGDVTGPDKVPGETTRHALEGAARMGWRWSSLARRSPDIVHRDAGGDPRFAWILANVFGRQRETDAEWAAVTAAAAKVKRAPWLDNRSRVLENWFGVLESGLSHDDYRFRRAVYVRTGAGHGHEHADALDLQVVAHGLPMTIDGGQRHGYSKPRDSFSRTHNMVEVDGGGTVSYGLLSHGWTRVLSDGDGARYLKAGAIPQPGVRRYERQVALIDVDEGRGSRPLSVAEQKPFAALPADVTPGNSYVVDVFRVAGGSVHTYGFHGPVPDDFQWNATEVQSVRDVSLREAREREETAGGEATRARAGGEKPSINPAVYLRDDANYLSIFTMSTGTKQAGNCPDQFQATWRYTREGDGSEKQMLGKNFHAESPRQFTRLTMLDASDLRALRADVVETSESPVKYRFTQTMLQRRAGPGTSTGSKDGGLESAFTAVIEPYAGEPFISSIRKLPVAGAETDALKPVAVEVKTVNGHTDVCFLDGRPEKMRIVECGMGNATSENSALRISAEFAYYSTDDQGLRQAALTGGTLMTGPDAAIRIAQPAFTGKITQVDYRKKTFRIDAAWPSSAGGQLIEIAAPGHATSYLTASARPAGTETEIAVTRGADYYRAPVESVGARNSVTCSLPIRRQYADSRCVVSNDDLTKFWVGEIQENTHDFVLDGGPVRASDFAPSHALRVWEYGVGDSVRLGVFCNLRRVDARVYEVSGNADAIVSLRATGVEISTDNQKWQPVTGRPEEGRWPVSVPAIQLANGPVYLRIK